MTVLKVADKKLIERDKRYKESLFKALGNRILVIGLKFISILPFWVIYGISDFFYVIINHIVGYRKGVISDNLNHAFPNKKPAEIATIRNKFYRHFCDMWLETVKMHSMSKKSMQKRITFQGTEILEKYYNQGRSVVLLTVHHNNWEWNTAVQAGIKHQGLVIYNPLRGSSAMEEFIIQTRERWGAKCIPIHKSGREILKYNRDGKPTLAVLAADQTPRASSRFWTIFLNREAPFFSGPEKIAIRGNQPVVFGYASKIKRGYYNFKFEELISEPQQVNSNEILLRYVRKTEEIIHEEPAYYLWSHRRWKHKRPEGIELTT